MRRNVILLLMLIFLVAVPGLPVGQASIEKVVLKERTIQDPLKSWSVTFTQPVNKGTIKKQNFSITDEKQRKVKAKLRLSEDGSKVTITPEAPYKEGVRYYLTIKGNVKSGSNAFLNEHTVLPFKVETRSKTKKGTSKKTENDNQQTSTSANQSKSSSNSKSSTGSNAPSDSKKESKHLLKAEATRHSHFVEISVQVGEQVVKVKAGNDELEYKGNGQFTLYKPGLTSGEKLIIKGYSLSNKTLATKEIVIP